MTVVRISSPSTSLQHLTPSLPEDTAPAEALESASDTEADQPPPLPRTDIPPQYATNLLIGDFVTDTNHPNSAGVGGVCYSDDQHGHGSLTIDLDAEIDDVQESTVKSSTDTLSTNISLPGANEDTYESRGNITELVNVDPTSNTTTSSDMQFDQIKNDEQLDFKETAIKSNELTLLNQDYTLQPNVNKDLTNDDNFFNAKEANILEQRPEIIFSEPNIKDEALVSFEDYNGNGTNDNSNVNTTSQSQSHSEDSVGDVNCSLDPLGKSFNTFTEEKKHLHKFSSKYH